MYIWYLPVSGGNCPFGSMKPCHAPSLKADVEAMFRCGRSKLHRRQEGIVEERIGGPEGIGF